VRPGTELLDPTGCGDAYRAGCCTASSKAGLGDTGRLASLLGTLRLPAAADKPCAESRRIEGAVPADSGSRAL